MPTLGLSLRSSVHAVQLGSPLCVSAFSILPGSAPEAAAAMRAGTLTARALTQAHLARIAARSAEPALAYGTDEEVGAGYDPQVNQRDLGDDPLAYATILADNRINAVSNELDRNQYGATLRYARPLFESKADLDFFAVWAQPRGDWTVRGRLHYALSDAMRLSLGFDLFRGPRHSFLGNLRANSLWFAEIGYPW